jgi:hypothetical protein
MKGCICGTVKNCGRYLDTVFKNIEKIGSLFEDYKIVIYYDKSEDNTLQKLHEYKNINSRLFFYVNKTPLLKFRTQNISRGRNFCLEYIRQNYIDYEMFIMMDLDDVCCKNINLDLLKKYLKREDWDGLSFNTSPHYYDIWGLSINPYYLSLFAFEPSKKLETIMTNHINNLLQNLKPGDLLQCASAFNGFSIYRTNKFINCHYDGKLRKDLLPFQQILTTNYKDFKFISPEDDCEHRAFHLEAINKNNANLRISPEILFK